jgi:hypothetical protein
MYGIIDAAIAAQPSPATCGGAEGGASNKARKVGLVLAPDNRSAGKAHTCTHAHTHTQRLWAETGQYMAPPDLNNLISS